LETFTFAAGTAKYVRIVGHGNTVNAWNSYTEVKVRTGTQSSRQVTLGAAKTGAGQTFAASADTYGDKLQQLSVFPNPVGSTATVAFTLQQAGPVHLAVYNTSGEVVKVLANEQLPAGRHSRTFTPGNMPGGLYVLKLVHNGKVSTARLVKQ